MLQPRAPTQAAIWNSDEFLLGVMASDFGYTALSLSDFLPTHDPNWTWQATRWVANAGALIDDAPDLPGGFPSARALGFNATGMCVAAGMMNALDQQFASGQFYPAFLSAVEQLRSVYENLTTRMELVREGVNPGENPVDTLGSANVTAIHLLLNSTWSAAFALSDLGLNWAYCFNS